ncbi:MAG: hypothetical protein ACE5E7_06875 [Anaerolineae bacterium]
MNSRRNFAIRLQPYLRPAPRAAASPTDPDLMACFLPPEIVWQQQGGEFHQALNLFISLRTRLDLRQPVV